MPRLAGDVAYLTPGQAARILGVSPKTVNRWANEGRVPCALTLGGHRRFRVDVIQAVAASMGLDGENQQDSSP
jgi:excisionase family DNA binding protein